MPSGPGLRRERRAYGPVLFGKYATSSCINGERKARRRGFAVVSIAHVYLLRSVEFLGREVALDPGDRVLN